jgi:hypothetical protein
MQAFREAAGEFGRTRKPDLNAALRMPGMLGGRMPRPAKKSGAGAAGSHRGSAGLLNGSANAKAPPWRQEMRAAMRIICDLAARMDEIAPARVPSFPEAAARAAGRSAARRGIEPQRLAQEAALLADRSDIAEELVRLKTHAAQLDALLAGDGEVGKRLDFLLQEMNREANTILSKTGGLGDLGLTITELALAAKSEIDKIREQSLNLE